MKKISSVKYLFIIGKPGSGKTTIADIIFDILQLQKINSCILNDWKVLNHFAEQKIFPDHIQSTDKGFKVLNDEIYKFALEKLMLNLLSESYCNNNIIEFSRRSYLSSFEYISKYLDKNSCMILYICADFEQCIIRNNKRISHQVPIEVMESYYRTDDRLLLEKTGFEIININNINGKEELRDKVKLIM